MTSTIITKNSSTASAAPLAADLTQGELAVNVTDKKLYSKDSGGNVVKLVGGLGNQEANAVAITGGAVNGTTVGATTASTGAFTTLSASSTVSGTGFSTYLASPPAIGGTAAAAVSATTLAASGAVTLSGGTANGVTYLNGSKVLTSGSALTFDGTNLATTGTITSGGSYNFNTTSGRDILWGTGSYTYITGNPATGVMAFGIASSELMRLTSTGLGIGTSSPSVKLHVKAATASADVFYAVNSNSKGLNLNTTASDNLQISHTNSNYNIDYWVSGTGVHTFSTGGSERMRLDSAGNLGLGATPAASLYSGANFNIGSSSYLQGTGNTYGLIIANNIVLNGSTSWRYINSAAGTQYSQQAGAHYWYNAPTGTAGNAASLTQAMTLDASGNLLVGTTSAGAKVYAVASGAQQAIRGDQSTAGAAAIYGTSSVNSGTGYVAYFTNSGSGTGLYISNTAAWQSTSDERLKTDIQDLDATARLLQLRPRDYLWKSQETSDEPNRRSFGFIAQEVKEVFPELVGVSPDGMFSVEYTGLIAPLVKAIQEQQAIIESLKARLAAANL